MHGRAKCLSLPLRIVPILAACFNVRDRDKRTLAHVERFGRTARMVGTHLRGCRPALNRVAAVQASTQSVFRCHHLVNHHPTISDYGTPSTRVRQFCSWTRQRGKAGQTGIGGAVAPPIPSIRIWHCSGVKAKPLRGRYASLDPCSVFIAVICLRS